MKSKIFLSLLLISLIFIASSAFAQMDAQKYEKANYLYRKTVKPIFQRKCFDCHSNHTHFPFFHKIPIIHQIIERDIRLGRNKLLYDQDFPFTSESDQVSLLNLIQHVIEADTMPPKAYRLVNPNKVLTAEEKEIIYKWIRFTREYLMKFDSNQVRVGQEPIQPLVPFDLDERKVSLGDKLFHDPRLSGNNSVSCATCHDLTLGGVDRTKVSVGINGAMGHVNAPTVFNSGYNIKQFWDGRAETLERQVDGPVQNGLEMGASWDLVIGKLKAVPEYVTAFNEVFTEGITRENVKKSIADFERSLITPSRFDDFLQGDIDALTTDEKEGYLLFKRYGCVSCHQGINVGGNLFQKIGKFHDYFKSRGTPIKREDYGRFNVTHKESDKFKFKVPSLRNVALTYPYFHDGSTQTLHDAISIMAKHQLGRNLSQREISLLADFLKSLTGKEFENEN